MDTTIRPLDRIERLQGLLQQDGMTIRLDILLEGRESYMVTRNGRGYEGTTLAAAIDKLLEGETK